MTEREPTDVVTTIRDFVKDDFATRFPELTVDLELPGGWKLGSDPALIFADDGDTLKLWPVATSPTIRVTSWSSGRERKYVNAAIALLLTTRIPGIAAILPGSGLLDARDPKTRADLSSFTVRTRARLAIPQ